MDTLKKNRRRVEMTTEALFEDFSSHLRYTLAKDRFSATDYDRYMALAWAVRDRVIERWALTRQTHRGRNVKRVYYLSLEFLIGRLMGTNMYNLGIEKQATDALNELGLDMEAVREQVEQHYRSQIVERLRQRGGQLEAVPLANCAG